MRTSGCSSSRCRVPGTVVTMLELGHVDRLGDVRLVLPRKRQSTAASRDAQPRANVASTSYL